METIFDVPQLKEEIRKEAVEMEQDSFWENQMLAQQLLKQHSQKKAKLDQFQSLQDDYYEALTLQDILNQDTDEELAEELVKILSDLTERISQLETRLLLNAPYDHENCYLTLKAGAGGTDAQDWTEILLRMYCRWLDKKKFSYSIRSISEGDEAGIKTVTLYVEGPYAYGLIKQDVGIHRLVRISPFNANGKRQTSFTALEATPELADVPKELSIPPDELKIDTFRASGAGGQHVNKTDSAIRITHLPTQIVAQSQSSRSQAANKQEAMKILISRLVQQLEIQHKAAIQDLKGDQKDIAWGSQIRSYVFHPYKLVKDHRTSIETSNLEQVLDGDLDLFIEGSLQAQKKEVFEET